MEEHDVVEVLADIDADDLFIKKGSRGTIVSVYGSGRLYAVEFNGNVIDIDALVLAKVA